MRPDPPAKSPTLSAETSKSPSPAPAAPTVRPKLNLQKRTVSEAESTSPASAVSDAKASPFGGARPIDTFAREKEVEEKRRLAIRQKKEQEEKAREEKRLARGSAKTEKAGAAAEANHGENGTEAKPVQSASSNFEILRKAGGEEEVDEDQDEDIEGVEKNENGGVVEDKDVKPREIVRDMPAGESKETGKGETETKPTESQNEATHVDLEGDGWSTVSKSKNNRRGNNHAARAIAS